MEWAAPFSVVVMCGLRLVAGPKAAGLWNHFGPQRVRREGGECGTQSPNPEKRAGRGTWSLLIPGDQEQVADGRRDGV